LRRFSNPRVGILRHDDDMSPVKSTKAAGGRLVRLRLLAIVALSAWSGAVASAVTFQLVANGVELSAVLSWLDGFVKSPGIAAIGVCIAAAIAFTGITAQVNVAQAALVQATGEAKEAAIFARESLKQARESANQTAQNARDSLEHDRHIGRDEAWWKSFEWASERAVGLNGAQPTFPWQLAIHTFQALKNSTDDSVKLAACGGVMELAGSLNSKFQSATREETADGSVPESTVELRQALSTWSATSKGTAAASPVVDARLYELEVGEAISALGFNRIDPRIELGEDLRYWADEMIVAKDRRVAFEFKYWTGERKRTFHDVVRSISGIRGRGFVEPIVFVAPSDLDISETLQDQLKLRFVRWADSGDNENLRRAIDEASRLPL
jgi:hypothetical protein